MAPWGEYGGEEGLVGFILGFKLLKLSQDWQKWNPDLFLLNSGQGDYVQIVWILWSGPSTITLRDLIWSKANMISVWKYLFFCFFSMAQLCESFPTTSDQQRTAHSNSAEPQYLLLHPLPYLFLDSLLACWAIHTKNFEERPRNFPTSASWFWDFDPSGSCMSLWTFLKNFL